MEAHQRRPREVEDCRMKGGANGRPEETQMKGIRVEKNQGMDAASFDCCT